LRFKDTDFGSDGNIGVVEVDHVLDCLAVQSPDAAHAVELHYFAGLTLTETANLMNTSVAAVTRQIRFAKAWLSTHIEERAKN
jgi:DNA-directed RNA polymerase specialized sigma24 family protein